ncbi:YbbR-like domain-containing protein [uncultured Algibacter sp.]|uniref:YbbR-like domain-containing protein n=1 Tax=uncultured Algibacter sp. TaxID=298659 RepID=UPI003216B28C
MIHSIKTKISVSIKNKKINVFFFFLISAFVILIFTKLSKNYTNTMVFEIEKINVPLENILLNDSIKLDVTLKTHGFKWLKYYVSKPKIKIDFSKDVYKHKNVFVWSKPIAYLSNTQFSKQVELLNITPDTLLFRYGVNLVKKVPVKLNATINYSHGYDLANSMVVQPDSVEVIGPNQLVDKISFVETENLVLNNIRTDVMVNTKLKLPSNQLDIKFSETDVNIKAKVEKFTEGTLQVPVTIINAPRHIELKYFPKKVSVSYYVSLNNFDAIKNKDFKVICDYSKTSDNQSFLLPELTKVPKLVKNAKISQQRIEFIITK